MVKETRKFRERPESRPFWLEEVTKRLASTSSLQRRFIVLNSQEYAKQFGTAPRSKDPTTPMIEISHADGSQENLFVFAHPDHPFREMVVSSEVGEHRCATVMPQSRHLHEHQPKKTILASQRCRIHGSGEKPALCQAKAFRISIRCQNSWRRCRSVGSGHSLRLPLQSLELQQAEAMSSRLKQRSLAVTTMAALSLLSMMMGEQRKWPRAHPPSLKSVLQLLQQTGHVQ